MVGLPWSSWLFPALLLFSSVHGVTHEARNAALLASLRSSNEGGPTLSLSSELVGKVAMTDGSGVRYECGTQDSVAEDVVGLTDEERYVWMLEAGRKHTVYILQFLAPRTPPAKSRSTGEQTLLPHFRAARSRFCGSPWV